MSRLWLGLTYLGLAGRLAAQVPDSAAAADSLRPDSTVDNSAMFLKTYEENRHRVPVFPRLGRADLLPALSRFVFDRDTLLWHNAETLSDLLAKVPGVFVLRGGWVGRPEPINFQGRAAAATEFLLDGVPYLPLGPDSLAVDPSTIALSFLERVEVERLPGLLRVHLFTRRHDRLPPRTAISVASGDFDIARYRVSLERRSASGFGFVVSAEHLAVPLRNQAQGAYSNTQAWLQASYLPKSSRLAAMVQWFRGGPNRGTVTTATTPIDTLSQGLDGGRSDFHANLSYRPDADGLGFTSSLVAARSSWTEDSSLVTLGAPDRHVRFVDQSLWQLGGRVGHRTRVSSIDGEVWHRTRWTPLDARGSISFSPIGGLTLNGVGVYQRHSGARTSRSVTARASLTLPLRFRLAALAQTGTILPHPSIHGAAVQSITDGAILGGFEHPRFAVEAGLWRTAGFEPQTFPLYRGVTALAPLEQTKWLTVQARLAPRQWFVLDGWYSNPIGGAKPQGLPPTHSIVSATIQSKFLRTYRSGIFGLKLQGTMESWGNGVIGLDGHGVAIPLKGATFFRALLQLRLGDFVAYYDRVNFQSTKLTYVPGLPILKLASTFGVRWEFSN